MKTVAIIAEYNPFHMGHEYQIRKIREEFGHETRIVVLMSGNYTQRGDVAIMDKSKRAMCAVLCGANLVLEIPFPFSMSSAEFFAKSGVRIANEIGVVDCLSFGSESGDIDTLINAAENMTKNIFKEKLRESISSSDSKEVGYPKMCEHVYASLFCAGDTDFCFSPNNILAFEYIKALNDEKSKILPHTVKRSGASFSEKSITDDECQSATAIREQMCLNFYSALDYVPQNTKDVLLSEYNNKQMPCDSEKISAAIISNFRLNPSPSEPDIQDAGAGLYNRLRNASFEANTIKDLISLTDTKKYTSARIRRAVWNSFFGVTSSTVKELPRYTQVLAMDTVGKTILKEIKKVSDFPILTKPSSSDRLVGAALSQKKLSDKADSVFQLTKPQPPCGNLALKTTPYVVK